MGRFPVARLSFFEAIGYSFLVKCFYLRLRDAGLAVSSIPTISLDSGSLDNRKLEIYSSGLLDWDEEQKLTIQLKSEARMAVSRWIQEKRYILRLLVSAVIFVISYFVFSLAVRDPLPVIDELVIAFALSTLYWIWEKRHDEKTELALVSRDMLYKAIEETDVSYSALVEDIERRYEEFSCSDVLDIAKKISIDDIPAMDIAADDAELFGSFKVVFHGFLSREEKSLLKTLKDIMEKKERGPKLKARIVHAYSTGAYDIYLLALAMSVFRTK